MLTKNFIYYDFKIKLKQIGSKGALNHLDMKLLLDLLFEEIIECKKHKSAGLSFSLLSFKIVSFMFLIAISMNFHIDIPSNMCNVKYRLLCPNDFVAICSKKQGVFESYGASWKAKIKDLMPIVENFHIFNVLILHFKISYWKCLMFDVS